MALTATVASWSSSDPLAVATVAKKVSICDAMTVRASMSARPASAASEAMAQPVLGASR